jgi:hypothetical protein
MLWETSSDREHRTSNALRSDVDGSDSPHSGCNGNPLKGQDLDLFSTSPKRLRLLLVFLLLHLI